MLNNLLYKILGAFVIKFLEQIDKRITKSKDIFV